MENKENKKNEIENKVIAATVETEEEIVNKKVLKVTTAKVVKKELRNGDVYYKLSIALTDTCSKEVPISQAELELMRMDKKNIVTAKLVEGVGKTSGKNYYELHIEICSEYTKYEKFDYAEYVVLKRLYNLA